MVMQIQDDFDGENRGAGCPILFEPPRCRVCGRFVSQGNAAFFFTPDSAFTFETTEWECRSCQKEGDA